MNSWIPMLQDAAEMFVFWLLSFHCCLLSLVPV